MVTEPVQPSINIPIPKDQGRKKILLSVLILLLVLGVGAYLLLTNRSLLPNGPKILAKVGGETIYRQDLDFEIAAYPVKGNPETDKSLLQKIIKDSIILQAAKKDDFIQLDRTVFNSPDKDYAKRIKLVEQAKQTVNKQRNGLKGAIVSIWFYNMKPGPVGYTAGKKIALQKITALYNDVKIGKVTIQQAGEEIKNDTSLAQLDPSYQVNALINFDISEGKAISFDQTFNEVLWKLQPGQLSELYLAKDKDLTASSSGKMIDAVYMFGQVSAKQTNSPFDNFEQWYQQHQRDYEIKYF